MKRMAEARYIKDLEAFMRAVARELKCLPSYAAPSPNEGNAHIMQKLRELTTTAEGAKRREK